MNSQVCLNDCRQKRTTCCDVDEVLHGRRNVHSRLHLLERRGRIRGGRSAVLHRSTDNNITFPDMPDEWTTAATRPPHIDEDFLINVGLHVNCQEYASGLLCESDRECGLRRELGRQRRRDNFSA